MKRINPFVGLFVAIATLMTAFFVPVFILLIDHGERLAAIETAIEAMQADIDEMRADIAAMQAAIAALSGDLAATNERMARIEGTVAGALGRPFPERMAEAPANPGAGG